MIAFWQSCSMVDGKESKDVIDRKTYVNELTFPPGKTVIGWLLGDDPSECGLTRLVLKWCRLLDQYLSDFYDFGTIRKRVWGRAFEWYQNPLNNDSKVNTILLVLSNSVIHWISIYLCLTETFGCEEIDGAKVALRGRGTLDGSDHPMHLLVTCSNSDVLQKVEQKVENRSSFLTFCFWEKNIPNFDSIEKQFMYDFYTSVLYFSNWIYFFLSNW